MIIRRNQLTLTTPNTLLMGVAINGQCAITGAIRLLNGFVESDVLGVVHGDLWQAIDSALDEARILYAKHLMILTTCDELHQWLQKPIQVEQPGTKKVWVGREAFTVKTGGNKYQWSLLRHLFRYVWRCEKVAALPGAEALLNGEKQIDRTIK